jgi:PRTRC genetic system protein E
MFPELMPLLSQRRLRSRADAVTIRVNIIPQLLKDNEENSDALTTPLRLTGTPEELDRFSEAVRGSDSRGKR